MADVPYGRTCSCLDRSASTQPVASDRQYVSHLYPSFHDLFLSRNASGDGAATAPVLQLGTVAPRSFHQMLISRWSGRVKRWTLVNPSARSTWTTWLSWLSGEKAAE